MAPTDTLWQAILDNLHEDTPQQVTHFIISKTSDTPDVRKNLTLKLYENYQKSSFKKDWEELLITLFNEYKDEVMPPEIKQLAQQPLSIKLNLYLLRQFGRNIFEKNTLSKLPLEAMISEANQEELALIFSLTNLSEKHLLLLADKSEDLQFLQQVLEGTNITEEVLQVILKKAVNNEYY